MIIDNNNFNGLYLLADACFTNSKIDCAKDVVISDRTLLAQYVNALNTSVLFKNSDEPNKEKNIQNGQIIKNIVFQCLRDKKLSVDNWATTLARIFKSLYAVRKYLADKYPSFVGQELCLYLNVSIVVVASFLLFQQLDEQERQEYSKVKDNIQTTTIPISYYVNEMDPEALRRFSFITSRKRKQIATIYTPPTKRFRGENYK